MCNPGIRGRHWKALSDIIGFDITPDSGSTLRKVLKLNLKPYMEEFEGISAGASKVRKYMYTLLYGNNLVMDNFIIQTSCSLGCFLTMLGEKITR